MRVVKADINDGHKPIILSGEFYHCANGNKPIFRGKTVFIKEGFFNEENINFMPIIFRDKLNEIMNNHD